MYNYFEAVEADVKEYLNNEVDFEGLKIDALDFDDIYETLYDEMWIDDGITGNGSGSYTFSTYEAEENLCHNSELLEDALTDFGADTTFLDNGAEALDVTIRCYLLGSVLSELLPEYLERYGIE